MAGNRYTIGTHTFYHEDDYHAALKDDEKIRALRKKTDFRDLKQVEELYRSMQSGAVRFSSVLGREFDDEVYEVYCSLKEHTAKAGAGKSASKKGGGKNKSRSAKEAKAPVNAHVEKQAKKILAARELRRRILIGACAVVAAASIGYFAYYYYAARRSQDTYDELAELKEKNPNALPDITVTVLPADAGEGEEAEPIVLTVLDEYKNLYNKNKSLIGWLKIDDTNIDYPVMQSQDQDYYLTHDFNQKYDRNGSIFLDPACSIVKRSMNLILYGHHMQSGKMFGSLEKYTSKSYYEKHKYITFDTIYEKGTYEVMYVFRSRIYNETDVVFKYYQFIDVETEAEFYSNMDEMAALSLYDTGVSAVYGDELLTLSTCDYQEKNGRFVVVAKRIS